MRDKADRESSPDVNNAAVPSNALWPLVLYFFAVLVLVVGMIGTSYVLGQRHMSKVTGEPFEAGMVPTGSAHQSWDVRFYLVAMLFVIFDLESVFIFAWAIALRPLGWGGYLWMAVFVAVLLAILAYLWREGALDWGSKSQKWKERIGRSAECGMRNESHGSSGKILPGKQENDRA